MGCTGRGLPTVPTLLPVQLEQYRIKGVGFQPVGMSAPEFVQLPFQLRVSRGIRNESPIGHIDGASLSLMRKVVMDPVPNRRALREQGFEVAFFEQTFPLQRG